MRRNNVFYLLINKNKKSFILLILFFMIGLVLGIIFVNNATSEQKNDINEYVNNMFSNIELLENANKNKLLIKSIKNNLSLIFVIFLLGCSVFIGKLIYFVIMYKGFSLGYTFSAIISSFGTQKRYYICYFNFNFTKFNFYPNIIYTRTKWNWII